MEFDVVQEYRDKPDGFVTASEAELRARSRRNVAIALSLLGFMAIAFIGMLARAGVI